jgi:hypothetical protein
MARLFGMHELELRPGVSPEAFEQFVSDELSRLLNREGQRTYVLKGDRGVREGKYVFVFEYDSAEGRDRDTPGPNQDSEELVQWLAEHRDEVEALFNRLSTFVLPEWDIGMHYTDYVVVGEA